MNDRYLFKAKRIDNGEWVIGLLTKMWGQLHIINPDDENTAYPIDESTLCQCTGLTDKNRTKIFEGNIINSNWGKFVIIYNTHFGGFVAADDGRGWGWEFLDEISEIEVIGNIHDNPELLKGGAKE